MTTVVVTGGNGFLGRHVIAALAGSDAVGNGEEADSPVARGRAVANVAERVALDLPVDGVVNVARDDADATCADAYRRADCTEDDAVDDVLDDVEPEAVVHLGMIPSPEVAPDPVVYESNALSPAYVCEAAADVGVDGVVLASSLCAMGAGFEPDLVQWEYLPVDEAHPLSPTTPYGAGKRSLEVVGDAVGRRPGPPTVVSLRYPWVVDDDAVRESFVGADRSLSGIREAGNLRSVRNSLFSYVHVADAVAATVSGVNATLDSGVDGHEPLFLSAPDTTTTTPTPELVAECYDAPVRGDLDGRAPLIDDSRAREVLDWEPRHSWRDGIQRDG